MPRPHKQHEFRIDGDTAYLVIVKRNGIRVESAISIEDLERVRTFPFAWCAKFDVTVGGYYVIATEYRSDCEGGVSRKRTVSLARFIAGHAPDGMQVDHIDRDTLNNRRSNLRVVTPLVNTHNKRPIRRNNKSGIAGVRWDPIQRKWDARIRRFGVQHFLGWHRTKDSAAEAVRGFLATCEPPEGTEKT